MSEYAEIINQYYDSWGSLLDVGDFTNKVGDQLSEKGFSKDNSRLVFSVCPDDVNRLNVRETAEKALVKQWDSEFHLGGLGAFPIGGITGITAASHHPPDKVSGESREEGNLIFFVSPHVGVVKQENLILGKMIRPGQEKLTSSCGAMIGFLAALKEAGNVESFKIAPDAENLDPTRVVLQNAIISQYSKNLDTLLNESDDNKQVADIFKVNYDLVDTTTKKMISTFMEREHFEGNIAFIGGITVNMPGKDMFILRDVSFPK